MNPAKSLCNPRIHSMYRRHFMGTLGWGMSAAVANFNSLTGLCSDLRADNVRKDDKRVIILYLGGGASQMETWDPKPGQPTGGPYGAIPTSVPGLHISELLPRMAQRMHHLAVVRSVDNSGISSDHHGTGIHIGRKNEAAVQFPTLAEICTKELVLADTQVPPHVELQVWDTFRFETKHGMSFLGSQYAPLVLTGGKRPPDMDRLPAVSEMDHADREALRDYLSRRFEQSRGANEAESYSRTNGRARGVMACDELLDVDRCDAADLARYGPTPVARHCLLARRLVEAGVGVVKIRDTWWDTHGDNFEGQRVKCANLDHALSHLIDDLVDRGLMSHTLLVVLSEFGRTPDISASLGRNHWPKAWSVVMGGCGIQGGDLWQDEC
ncbi:MAG: DUF1501 domain-containing protein [Planctomycetota bacterium]|nr:DUF1501 domain-containing protein [Planctomycetota bacterium]